MSLVSSHDWHDHIDLIEGEPDFVETKDGVWARVSIQNDPKVAAKMQRLLEDGSVNSHSVHPAEAKKEIMALCLLCYASHPIGRYIYENHPIELEDGTTTTFEDWRAEAGRNRVGKSRRRRMYCPRCDLLTEHVAES